MNELEAIAKDLAHAATVGGAQAGAAAVQAGALQAEVGLRTSGAATVAASGLGGLTARVGMTQRRGVYQESAPATAVNIDTDALAGTMADVAAAEGARAVTS